MQSNTGEVINHGETGVERDRLYHYKANCSQVPGAVYRYKNACSKSMINMDEACRLICSNHRIGWAAEGQLEIAYNRLLGIAG